MTVTQITLNMPNQPGQMARVSEMMGLAGVNILALFISTTTPGGDGLMRFVADKPQKALDILRKNKVEATTEEVIAAETPHHAGGLQEVLTPLKDAGVNVDYLYPWIQSGDLTILILGTADIKKAVAALQKKWIRLYGEELFS